MKAIIRKRCSKLPPPARRMLLARQTYAAMAEIVVKQLPTGQRVVDLVGERLRAHWMGQVPEYKHIVVGLLDVQEVKDAILGWWGVLVGALVENSKKPPSSKRALAYEEKREEERFPKQEEFSSEPSIVRKALELGVDSRRVAHKLTCVFGAIDEVSPSSMVGILKPDWYGRVNLAAVPVCFVFLCV